MTRAWMAWLLTGSILAVYVAQLLGARRGIDVVGNDLAFSSGAMAEHRYGTLITYAWAHAIPLTRQPAYLGFHLAANVIPLFCIGPALERWRGPWCFLALYLGGVVASALTWYLCDGRGEVIGASGAVFALFTAAGTLGLHLRRVDFVFFTLPLWLNLRIVAVLLVGIEVMEMFVPGRAVIAHGAHVGGGLFGVLFVLLVRGWELVCNREGLR